ncbi:HK97 gp10 family phage protein [Alteribacillus sp. YIM 98480]|uniref:HK97 gp10 family phage protein n=1 Tax=Alteribacillus sp. YIM 98480 TaxID=2606599 RepID=UPI00131EC592|nr:HK97 gp10 family phage protein [Alteribacillus sp. YIM 98480]
MALNIDKAIQDVRQKREKVATDISMLLEREAKQKAPVLTGHLRRNTNAEAEHNDDSSSITVGTNNVEYAEAVHEGSLVKQTQGQPYIRDSIEMNMQQMQKMIQDGMKTS